jgi:hypothetical protein
MDIYRSAMQCVDPTVKNIKPLHDYLDINLQDIQQGMGWGRGDIAHLT